MALLSWLASMPKEETRKHKTQCYARRHSRFHAVHARAGRRARADAGRQHDDGQRSAAGDKTGDKAFVQAASSAGSTEIDAAKLATQRWQDKDVKSFAHHDVMVDHTKLTMQLKMAAPKGVTVPKDNSGPSVLESLQALKGKEFDTAYIQKVGIQGHQEAVTAFQTEAEHQNADLKKAAQKALPTIQEHLKMAQALAAKKDVQSSTRRLARLRLRAMPG